MTKKKIGLILIVLSIICLIFVIAEISANIAHEGLHREKIQTYRPPFYGHGALVIGVGVLGAVSFFTGMVLIILDKINR